MDWLNGKDTARGSVQAPPQAQATELRQAESERVPAHGNGSNPFTKAVKYAAKGRVALVGPAGSGKSYTSLLLARALAGPNGRIAAIDTEHGSLSKYADLFNFDVIELDSFSPETFIESLHAAEAAHYDVFLCDSLSHFWVGRDGALEFVDMAAKRNKDNMGGWKEFRPHERRMVDEMVSSPCHVICTMRTKTDYQEQTDDKGKKKRVKIGLAPVQREGLEYEFDLVGYMDEDNTFIADKTRCSAYSQKAFTKPGPKEFAPFVEWLQGAARGARPQHVEPVIDTGGHPMNTAAAAQHVAAKKIAAGNPASQATWRTMGECERAFAAQREAVGEVQWREMLDRYGWKSFADIRKALDAKRPEVKEQVAQCYSHLDAIARKEVA
jgi:energy-coupling factor transporter ATP-binding protein EcfA2